MQRQVWVTRTARSLAGLSAISLLLLFMAKAAFARYMRNTLALGRLQPAKAELVAGFMLPWIPSGVLRQRQGAGPMTVRCAEGSWLVLPRFPLLKHRAPSSLSAMQQLHADGQQGDYDKT